jgi:hypothetical protein
LPTGFARGGSIEEEEEIELKRDPSNIRHNFFQPQVFNVFWGAGQKLLSSYICRKNWQIVLDSFTKTVLSF